MELRYPQVARSGQSVCSAASSHALALRVGAIREPTSPSSRGAYLHVVNWVFMASSAEPPACGDLLVWDECVTKYPLDLLPPDRSGTCWKSCAARWSSQY